MDRPLRWFLVFVWGCRPGDDPQPDTAGDPTDCAGATFGFTPGTGENAALPLADGDDGEIVEGPQGGWHLWTAAELTGTGPTVTLVSTIVAVENGLVLAAPNDGSTGRGTPVWIDLTVPGAGTYDPETCSGTFYGLETRLDDFAVPTGDSVLDVVCGLDGRALDFTISVTEPESGQSASATVEVVARLDDGTAESCRDAQ